MDNKTKELYAHHAKKVDDNPEPNLNKKTTYSKQEKKENEKKDKAKDNKPESTKIIDKNTIVKLD